MPASLSQTQHITCPQCGAPFDAEIWLIVDAAERPDLDAACRAGTIHQVVCPNGHAGMVAAPILYHNRAKKQLLLGIPPGVGEKQMQDIGKQLIGRLRSMMLILPGNDYLERPQAVPVELLGPAIEGKLQEALDQMQSEIQKNPALASAFETLSKNRQIAQTLQEWIEADARGESQQFLEAHPELLSDEGEQTLDALSQVAAAGDDPASVQVLGEHRKILAAARRDGVASAYDSYAAQAEQTADADRAELDAKLREYGVQSQADLDKAVEAHPELAELLDRVVMRENPLLVAMNALMQSRSPKEVEALAHNFPELLTDPALATVRKSIDEARAQGDSQFVQAMERRLQVLERLKAGGSQPPAPPSGPKIEIPK